MHTYVNVGPVVAIMRCLMFSSVYESKSPSENPLKIAVVAKTPRFPHRSLSKYVCRSTAQCCSVAAVEELPRVKDPEM